MRQVVSLAVLLLAGCAGGAGVDAESCRRADWYDIGFRDAIFGLQRQEEVYTLQCERHGVKVDGARYVQGWVEGKYEADRRNVSAHD
jgi:hypothetical protein